MTMPTKLIIMGMMLSLLITPACKPRNDTPVVDALPAGTSDEAVDISAFTFHASIDEAHRQTAATLITSGVDYLLSRRDADGGWGIQMGDLSVNRPAITAMAIKALLQDPRFNADSPEVTQAFDVLLSYQKTDGPQAGGIYAPGEGTENYSTAIAVMALAMVEDDRYADQLASAVAYLRGIQIVPGAETPDLDMIDEEHPFVGGVSYGKHGRPDLSNVGMWMEAMHDAGVPGDDPAMQRALAFVSRTQNRGESNNSAWAAVGPNDDGFVYAPALAGELESGESKALMDPNGGLRSYGSMTYTGFKSMLYADVSRDDPRVVGAWRWIREYWGMDANPNMPPEQRLEGLFYYYHMLAKALRAWGEDTITDGEGLEHNWREELIDAAAVRVKGDGSWANSDSRWYEDRPNLGTCYLVLSLQEAIKP